MQLAKKIGGGSYSTSEIDTGETWIDGKKIYKKTILLTGSYTGVINNIDIGLSSIDKFVSSEGMIYSDTLYWFPFPASNPSYSTQSAGFFIMSDFSLALRLGSLTYSIIILTLKYTKT